MTELSPAEADAELRAVLDLLDNGGRHCGCDPDLYGDSDFIGMVSDSRGRNHQEVRGAAIRALLAERDRLREGWRRACALLADAGWDGDERWETIRAEVEEPHAAPDPLNLPAYAWGESVTWNQGRILVPLNRDNETVADLVLDEDAAGTLAAMLDDAAGHKPPDCPRCFDRGYVPDWSRGLSAEHGEPGKKPCPDYQGDAVARETIEP